MLEVPDIYESDIPEVQFDDLGLLARRPHFVRRDAFF